MRRRVTLLLVAGIFATAGVLLYLEAFGLLRY